MFNVSVRCNTLMFGLVNITIVLYFMLKSHKMEAAVKNHINEKCYKCELTRASVERINMAGNAITKTNESFDSKRQHSNNKDKQNLVDTDNNNYLTPLYVITPTYLRGTQKPDLTRLAQTLMLVPRLHWIVVEDAHTSSDWVEDLLQRTGLKYTHLHIHTPAIERRSRVRGCSQRNEALKWIKKNEVTGVMYFADDDNAYDIRLFAEIRTSIKVGLVPTGNLAKTGISSPIVKNGKVIGFVDVWKGGRKFPVEMASMAINIDFWLKNGAPLFDYKKMGYLETRLLEAMKITLDDLEPKADDCTKIYTWHTNTVKVATAKSYTSSNALKDTNIPKLIEEVDF